MDVVLRFAAAAVCALLVARTSAAGAPTGWAAYAHRGKVYRCAVGGEPEELHSGRAHHACWSATGKYIYFIESRGGIWRMNNDGSGAKKLCRARSSSKCPIAAWRPDDESVFYVEGGAFCRIDGRTGERHLVHQERKRRFIGEFAVDGKGARIAARGTNDRLYKIAVDGPAEEYSRLCSSSVSPDGTLLTNNCGAHTSMEVRGWDGDRVEKVKAPPRSKWDNQRFAVNSDDLIVFMDRRGVGVVRISDNEHVAVARVRKVSSELHPDFLAGELPSR